MEFQPILGLLIFLRHGQAQNNVERRLAGRSPGVSLTKTGIQQVKDIAKFLKKMKITSIYSSPIERAKQTAEIVATHCSLDYKTDDRLIELDMGKFTGKPYDEIFASHGNVFLKFYDGDVEIANNGVETFIEVKKRIFDMIQYVNKEHNGENVLFVTHMDPIKAVLSNVLSLKPESIFELIVANASLTIFNDFDGKLSLKAINVMGPNRFDLEW